MNLKLEIEFSKAEILIEIDDLKQQIDAMRPLPADVEGKVMQKLRLDWNYHSNAIEGNKLSYGETVAFLMEGITAKGKPLKDHLDIRGHNEAILFLTSLVKDARPISESEIRALHQMILVEPYEVKAQTADGLPTTKQITLGEYKKSANHVKTATGELHYYVSPEETPAKMQELMEWYHEAVNEKINPVVLAALFHHKFVAIHPFDDGNGRLSRLLMNLILMQAGYPPVVIKMDDRQNYYSLLSRADNNDNWPFVEYVAERLESSLQLYLRAARGGDIEEDDDIDKEIALFKIDLKNRTIAKKKVSKDDINKLVLVSIVPLISTLLSKLKSFNELFEATNIQISTSPISDLILDYDYKKHVILDIAIKNIIERNNRKIEAIKLFIEFAEFKDSNNTFSINKEIEIEFGNEDYSITDLNDIWQISRPYNQKLSNDDNNFIVKNIVKNLKDIINDKFEN